jgi:hypothetical protein
VSGSSPTEDEILAAIEASGYLMEQEVASRIEKLGFHVQTARAFKDVDEGKSREMDVWAFNRFLFDEQRRLAGFCQIIAECKNSNNPFVFITRNKSASDVAWIPPSLHFPIEEYEGRKELGGGRAQLQIHKAFKELGFNSIHHFHKKENKAVQFCRIDRNGKNWSANHSGLYDSIFYPLLKALRAEQEASKPRHGADEYRYARFFFPIVVVRGKLYEIDSTAENRTPIEVPHVPFVREMKANGIEGRFLVDFVNEDHLEQFVDEVVKANMTKMIEIYENDVEQLLKKGRPWRDAPNQ